MITGRTGAIALTHASKPCANGHCGRRCVRGEARLWARLWARALPRSALHWRCRNHVAVVAHGGPSSSGRCTASAHSREHTAHDSGVQVPALRVRVHMCASAGVSRFRSPTVGLCPAGRFNPRDAAHFEKGPRQRAHDAFPEI